MIPNEFSFFRQETALLNACFSATVSLNNGFGASKNRRKVQEAARQTEAGGLT
jgi:hypothetical protein